MTTDNTVMGMTDTAAREAAIVHIDRSYIMSAPAGSGKTETMIQRILNTLAGDGKLTEPEQLVAITFTKKAATEMRNRLLKALEDAKNEPEPTEDHKKKTWELANKVLNKDKERGWNLLEMPERLQLRTIDSFCQDVIRRFALDGGNGVVPVLVADGLATTQLHRKIAQRALDLVRKDKAAMDFFLMYRQEEKAIAALVSMLDKRDQWKPGIDKYTDAEAFAKASLEWFPQHIEQAAQQQFEQVVAHLDGEDCLDLVLACGEQTDLQNLATVAERVAFCLASGALLYTKKKELRKPTAKDKPARVPLYQKCVTCTNPCKNVLLKPDVAFEKITAAHEILIDDTAPEQRALQVMWHVLRHLLTALQDVCHETGQVDYTGAADRACAILEEMNRDHKIRHLLIDEFQDSARRQHALVRAVTKNWSSANGNTDARTLFFVGDKMQSIYRFRQAEVELFQQVEDASVLGEVKLERLDLTQNFRSTQPMVRWFNEAFGAVLGTSNDPAKGAVRYSEATAGRTDDNAKTPYQPVKLWLEDTADDDVMVEIIHEFWKDNINGKAEGEAKEKCAVLVRGRAHLANVLLKLRDTLPQIRYQAVDIDNMSQRQPIVDLLSLTCALAHPCDNVAWLSVLRAPWCGATLAQIGTFVPEQPSKDNDKIQTVASKLREASDALPPHIKRVWTILEPALKMVHRTADFALLVEQTWLALGGPCCVADESDLDGARIYFDMLHELAAGGTMQSLEALTDALGKLFAPPMVGNHAECIQVMTIHKAKGLEFHTVILPGANKQQKYNSSFDQPVAWFLPDAKADTLPVFAPTRFLPHLSRNESPMQQYLDALSNLKDKSELRRLFYVGGTRAEHQLHIIGNSERKSGDSFGGFLSEAAMADYVDAAKDLKEATKKRDKSKKPDTIAKYQQEMDAAQARIDAWTHPLMEHCILEVPKTADGAPPADAEAKPTKVRRLSEDSKFDSLDSVVLKPVASKWIKQPVAAGADDETEDGAVARTADAENRDAFILAGASSESDNEGVPFWLGKMCAGSSARIAGTVVHAWLERMAQGWTCDEDSREALIKTELRTNGLYRDLDAATKKVLEAVQAVESKHPYMIAKHDEDYCELAVSVVETKEDGTSYFKDYIIDRLWRVGEGEDEDAKWVVVDYKTTDLTDKPETEIDELLKTKAHVAGYDTQLINYGKLVMKRFNAKPENVSCYLYFPLMNKSVKIEPSADGKPTITVVTKIA